MRSACKQRRTRWILTTCSLKTLELFVAASAGARAVTAGRFQYIHVDEYQDTNYAQYDACSRTDWRESGTTCASWATTTSPSTAGAARTSATSSISSRIIPNCQDHQARAELPLHLEYPRRGEQHHRPQRGAQGEKTLDRNGRRRADYRSLTRATSARRPHGFATASGRCAKPARTTAIWPCCTA